MTPHQPELPAPTMTAFTKADGVTPFWHYDGVPLVREGCRPDSGTNKAIYLYTAEQMHAYAASRPADGVPETGSWIAADDVHRHARTIDVALNGEDGAAKRPALCDVVAQIASLARKHGPITDAIASAPTSAQAGDSDLTDYVRISHLIGSIFFYGDFQAETFNERELERLLRKVGRLYQSEAEVIAGDPVASPAPDAAARASGDRGHGAPPEEYTDWEKRVWQRGYRAGIDGQHPSLTTPSEAGGEVAEYQIRSLDPYSDVVFFGWKKITKNEYDLAERQAAMSSNELTRIELRQLYTTPPNPGDARLRELARSWLALDARKHSAPTELSGCADELLSLLDGKGE